MRLSELHAILAHPLRLRLLHLLSRGPLCVCHLQRVLRVSQVLVSKHLRILRRSRLVAPRRRGVWVVYALPAPCSAALAAQVECLRRAVSHEPVLQNDLRRLDELLRRLPEDSEVLRLHRNGGGAS